MDSSVGSLFTSPVSGTLDNSSVSMKAYASAGTGNVVQIGDIGDAEQGGQAGSGQSQVPGVDDPLQTLKTAMAALPFIGGLLAILLAALNKLMKSSQGAQNGSLGESLGESGSGNMTGDKAIGILRNSPECWDNSGLMDRNQLANIAQNKDGHFSKDQMAAAQYLLDNPAEFDRFESRTDGKNDGKLGKGDIDLILKDDTKRAAQDLKSARIDGKPLVTDSNPLTLGDMERIAGDTSGKYDQKTRDAARFFVENPDQFKKAGNAAYNDNDGKLGGTDLDRIASS